ncbi:MAG TPA: hypothetical protein VNU93_09360 [Verrucomicrobiae bacterium]|nr:hypothetical protein [Verrucomicrobiae bacterium]
MDFNLNDLPLIGQGSHGRVYRLDEHRCLKICRTDKHIALEYEILQRAAKYPQFARVYECEGNYMIREYFDGPNLGDYLKQHGFNKDIAAQMLEILDIFKQLGFNRWDCRFSHIIVTEGGKLRVIDPTNNMKKVALYPRKMMNGLKKLGYEQQFLDYVKEVRPDYYALLTKGP